MFCKVLVETDKDGNYKNFEKDASKPDNKHVLEDGSKNLYGLYNDKGVRIGTVEKRKNKDGKYEWALVDDPKNNTAGNGGVNFKSSTGDKSDETYVETYGDAGKDKPSNGATNKETTKRTTETYSETKDGYRYTYKVTTTKKYDKNGELIESYSSQPELVGKIPLQAGDTPDKSDVASTLDKEYSRMSQKVDFNTTKATELLSKLNALRKKNGARTLSNDTSSDLYKLACIRVADMALYNHSSTNSPLYGKIEETVERFGLDIVDPTQNLASYSDCSASSLNTKFQSRDQTRETRMNNAYGQVAVVIVDKDGMTYAIELFAQ